MPSMMGRCTAAYDPYLLDPQLSFAISPRATYLVTFCPIMCFCDEQAPFDVIRDATLTL